MSKKPSATNRSSRIPNSNHRNKSFEEIFFHLIDYSGGACEVKVHKLVGVLLDGDSNNRGRQVRAGPTPEHPQAVATHQNRALEAVLQRHQPQLVIIHK